MKISLYLVCCDSFSLEAISKDEIGTVLKVINLYPRSFIDFDSDKGNLIPVTTDLSFGPIYKHTPDQDKQTYTLLI